MKHLSHVPIVRINPIRCGREGQNMRHLTTAAEAPRAPLPCEISKSASDFFPLANLSQTRSLAARSFVKLLSLLNWRLANLEMFSGIFPVPLWSKTRNTNKWFPLSQLHFSLEKALIQVFSTVVTWGLSKQSQTRSKMSFFSFAKPSHD